MRIKLPNSKKIIIPLLSLGIVIILLVFLVFINKESAEAPAIKNEGSKETEQKVSEQTNQKLPENPAQNENVNNPPTFNKQLYSLTEPSSLWMIVNKKRPLPSDYVPSGMVSTLGGQMRQEASNNLIALVNAGSQNGHNLYVISSYRSYSTQQTTYNGWVARDGATMADTYSARAGHSEHQTGLAVDLGGGSCDLETCFGNTPAGIWLRDNATKYGFIIRYTENKDSITGYQYEPWHLRYVGAELANEIAKTPNQTLEEFFGLSPAPSY